MISILGEKEYISLTIFDSFLKLRYIFFFRCILTYFTYLLILKIMKKGKVYLLIIITLRLQKVA